MRKLVAGLILLVLLCVFSVTLANTTTYYNMNLTSGSPTTANCTGSGAYYYQLYTITAPATGSYTFTMLSSGPYSFITLYNNGGFTTGSYCFNTLFFTNSTKTITLTAGQTYQLVGVIEPPPLAALTGSFTVMVDAPDAPPPTSTPKPVVVAPAASNDSDGDGVDNSHDNCINEYNPGQEDGWGGPMGDKCDNERYGRAGQDIAGFVQKNGMFDLHGNCIFLADGAARCPIIASFDPLTFKATTTSKDMTSVDANGWSVWLYFLYTKDGVDVYQVNTYSTNPPQPTTLVDDKLEIHVTGSTWQWYERGGNPQYHGI